MNTKPILSCDPDKLPTKYEIKQYINKIDEYKKNVEKQRIKEINDVCSEAEAHYFNIIRNKVLDELNKDYNTNRINVYIDVNQRFGKYYILQLMSCDTTDLKDIKTTVIVLLSEKLKEDYRIRFVKNESQLVVEW